MDAFGMDPSIAPEARGRLRKQPPRPHHGRSFSAHASPYTQSAQPSLRELQEGNWHNSSSGIPVPLEPPPVIGGSNPHLRSSSMDGRSRLSTPSNYSRPITLTSIAPGQAASAPSSPNGGKAKKKSGWFSKTKKDASEERRPIAWIAGHPRHPAYDVLGLMNGRPMPELWDDSAGNCLVYLFPRSAGKGPSFKIDSAVFASSPVLIRLAFGDSYSNSTGKRCGDKTQVPLDTRPQDLLLDDWSSSPRQQHAAVASISSFSSQDSRGRLSHLSDPPTETHLYLSIKFQSPHDTHASISTPPRWSKETPNDPAAQDLQTLIDIRNFFAFLCGQSLVATERKPSFFHIFMIIAGILKSYDFSSLDGSTFGEVAHSSFDNYVEELRLADVRSSREKTIEGIVLGERMKSVALYNEAFTHAAGKLEDLTRLKNPKFDLLSSTTNNRLIRASMDLEKRTRSVQLILQDFDFPALFTGIVASKTSNVRKEGVHFESWKDAFFGFRKNYLSILKNRYGDWPPSAKSKKNNLETSGLNRLVLRDMYNDMTALYDLLVDRHSLTSRNADGIDKDGPKEEPVIRALRAVLSEYDRSSPPVKPPIPFDLPLLPKLHASESPKPALHKKLRDDETTQLLLHSWNKDALANPTPFLQAFWEMERRAAHACTLPELADLRIGQWIFMYVVLQALPMLACDAPGLKWTQGVEYFLCEMPRRGVPWAINQSSSAAAPVSQTSDAVEHGVEGIYRRSHCWVMAERWAQGDAVMHSALREQTSTNAAAMSRQQRPVSRNGVGSGYSTPEPVWPPPTHNFLAHDSRPGSWDGSRNSSLSAGLESLPLPVSVRPDVSSPTGRGSPGGGTQLERPRSAHAQEANKTFDDILASVNAEAKKGKRK